MKDLMILRSPTSLLTILLTGLLFIVAPVYAESDFSLKQSHNLLVNDSPVNTSTNSSRKTQLLDMLFEEGLDKHLRYDIGVDSMAGIKVYSSVVLKLRTDATYLQYRMTF